MCSRALQSRRVARPGARSRNGSAPACSCADGSLDRAALARIVFADRVARADLEAIVHPDVYRASASGSRISPPERRLAIADIPLLFETGHQHDFDVVIVCACEPAEQLRRAQQRDGLSEAEARARIASQWPIDEKVKRAHHVIRTDGTFDETDAQVEAVYVALAEGRT